MLIERFGGCSPSECFSQSGVECVGHRLEIAHERWGDVLASEEITANTANWDGMKAADQVFSKGAFEPTRKGGGSEATPNPTELSHVRLSSGSISMRPATVAQTYVTVYLPVNRFLDDTMHDW
jgi:hypothetical protein